MSVVMSPSVEANGRRPRGVPDDKQTVRVHRISSRYPAIQVRTRMDSYVHGVTDRRREDDDGDEREDEDEDDDDDDDCSSETLDTAAGCSSASDTDFYYEDCHGKHTTVVEIRAEEVDRTEAVQEEFEDSLQMTDDRRRRRGCRTTEVVTKHRHVLAESCRVKVQNLRYPRDSRARAAVVNNNRARYGQWRARGNDTGRAQKYIRVGRLHVRTLP